jgi:hypothetical protein
MEVNINDDKTIILIKMSLDNDTRSISIDREFINNNITPNFTVEMFYYVLLEFNKYKTYKLTKKYNYYVFEGYYYEPYDQGDEIYITFKI